MPRYEYYCEANQTTITVRHGMKEKLVNWGELCEHSDHPLGNTDPGTPVEKLLGGGMVLVAKRTSGSSGSCCGEAGCSSGHHGVIK